MTGKTNGEPLSLGATFGLPARYDFDETLRFQQVGPADPTTRRSHDEFWKAGRTPDGPVTLHLARVAGEHEAVARAWGPGAPWALARVPAMLGLLDDPRQFAPEGPLGPFARRHSGLHLSRSPWPFDALCATVLQQRVRFTEAARAYARLARRLREAAPRPSSASPAFPELLLPPDPARLREVPMEFWLDAGVEPRRVATLLRLARHATAIDALFDAPYRHLRARLAEFRGCGPWTVETVLGLRLGDADAAPPGDVHLPRMVGWALAGEADADDTRMLELLEPFRPNRYRVIRILFAEGISAPAPGPRRYGSGWAARRRIR